MNMTKYMSLAAACLFLLTPILIAAQTSQQIEKTLLGHLEKFQNRAASDSAVIEKENKALKADLLRYAKLRSVLRYNFPALSKKMFIATSRDGKFRIYSWDNESGGTMRDFENVYEFEGRDGRVYATERKSAQEGDYGSFYTQIFQIAAPEGMTYLANSTFIASTSLSSQALSAFRVDGAKLNSDVKIIRTQSGIKNSVGFQYDFFSVVEHPERPVKLFFYDEAKKSFRFPIVIQDKKTPQGRVTNRYITYRYTGKYFERAK